MTTGAVVWAVIGAAWLVLALAGATVPGVPSFVGVARAFLGSWAGRGIALAAWASAGWHLFCQRP